MQRSQGHRTTWLALSSALLLASSLSACSGSAMGDMMGRDRTVPNDSDVSFGNRRAPALNPDAPAGGQSSNTSGRRTPVNNDSAANEYPALASVPAVPEHSSAADTAAEFKSMTAERDVSESARRQVLNDPSATVLTSPQTGQLVAAPVSAAPAPQMAMQEGAKKMPVENAQPDLSVPPPVETMNEVQSQPRDVMPAPAPASVSVPPAPAVAAAQDIAPLPPAPLPPGTVEVAPGVNGTEVAPGVILVNNSAAQVASAPAPAPALMTPADAVPMPPIPGGDIASAPIAPMAPMAAPLPQASMEPAPVANAPVEMEPVHLHPPAAMAAQTQTLPDVNQPQPLQQADANYAPEPVTLVAPTAASAQTHYLAESRYASRRAHSSSSND